jgi:hypothetical protein
MPGCTGLSQDLAVTSIATPRPGLPPGLPAPAGGLGPSGSKSADVQLTDALFAELCGALQSHHFEVVQARAAVGGQPATLHLRSQLTSWTPLRELLQQVGLDESEKDPWRRLGCHALEGSVPTAARLERSWEWARTLLALADGPGWTDEDRERAEEAKAKFAQAREVCLTALPELLSVRRRHKAAVLPQYQELGPEALELVHSTQATAGERVLTQLSAVVTHDCDCRGVWDVNAARELTTKLYAGDAAALAKITPTGAIFWAPSDPAALGRLKAALMKHCGDHSDFTCRLLAVIPTFPGCTTASSITDLCWSPIMGAQWAGLVKGLQFLPQPVQVVTTGSAGPLVGRKGLLLATIAAAGTPALMKVIEMAEPMIAMAMGPTYLVDAPAAMLPAVQGIIRRGLAAMHAVLGGTGHSPGSSKEVPRVRFSVHFPVGTSELDVALHMGHLRRQGGDALPKAVTFGNQGMYVHPGCMLLETTGPEAMQLAWPLCRELLPVAADRALIITDVDEEAWRQRMDDAMQEDAEVAMLQIKWRPSNPAHGGRPWVTPSATPQQLAAVRRAARPGGGTQGMAEYSAELQVLGQMGADPLAVVHKLMEVVGHHAGIDWRESDAGPDANRATWHWIAKSNPSAAPGRIRLSLQTEAQALAVSRHVHGRAVQLGAELISLECTAAVQDLTGNALLAESSTKNGGRGPGRRPRAERQ